MSETPIRAAASRLAGRFARTRASRRVIPWFVRHYDVDLAEAAVPAEGFASLQEFFCRPLRPGARPIAAGPGVVVAPADATLGACGRVAAGQVLQAKGSPYVLAALLGEAERALPFEGGVYATLYLAPANYHRVHAPTAGRIAAERYIAGNFHSVNPRVVAKIPALFAGNERWISYLESPAGCIAVVLVGACLVGGIQMNQTPPYAVERGQEIGRFEFGSTVILIAEAAAGWELEASPGATLRMGETLAHARL